MKLWKVLLVAAWRTDKNVRPTLGRMKLCKVMLVAAAWLVTATAGQAQQKYTIKIKELGEGESAIVEVKDSSSFKSTTTIENQKEPKTEEFTGSKHLRYTETVLERPNPTGLPTKLVRSYDTAVIKGSGGPFGKTDKVPPYHGKTVLIEKKGPAYEFRLQGGGLIDKDAPELVGEFSGAASPKSKKAFLPPAAVAVGGSWKIDPKEFGVDPSKLEGAQVLKSEGKAKLIKVYNKDGRLFGVVEVVVEVQMKATTKTAIPGDALAMEMKAAVTITFDGCIDGTWAEGRMGGSAEMNSKSSQRRPDVGMVSSIGHNASTGEYAWKELPKK